MQLNVRCGDFWKSSLGKLTLGNKLGNNLAYRVGKSLEEEELKMS
jgi:hypothetical protein